MIYTVEIFNTGLDYVQDGEFEEFTKIFDFALLPSGEQKSMTGGTRNETFCTG